MRKRQIKERRMEQPMNINDFVTAEQAADISGYDEDYVRSLARQGKIQGQKFGKQWMISRNSLETYIKQQKAKKEEGK